jgi:hypothetical protein
MNTYGPVTFPAPSKLSELRNPRTMFELETFHSFTRMPYDPFGEVTWAEAGIK